MQRNPTMLQAITRDVAESKQLDNYCPVTGFPLGVVSSINQGLMDEHTHDRYSELVLITDGYGTHCIGGQRYSIRSGDIFVVSGDIPHYYSDGYGLSLVNVVYNWEGLNVPAFDVGELAAYQSLFVIDPANTDPNRFDHRFRLRSEDFNRVLEEIRALDALLRKQPSPAGVRFLAITKFLSILTMIFDAYERQSNSGEIAQPRHQLGELAAMLERNYAAPISVQAMCRKAHISYASLFRQFRKFYHDSPINYLIRQRLSHAADMLRNRPEKTVGEIAYDCGFSDSAYFSRKFREYYKVSPSAYRKG